MDNNVPSNVFEVANLANGDGFVYVGKSSLVDNNSGNKTLKEGSNCLSTFLFGSIIPGRNIRLDIPTEVDPNTFIDAKFFDFQSYSPLISGSCTLGKTQDTSGDVSYYFRALKNDGSSDLMSWTIIEADDASFYIGYDGKTYYKQADGSYSLSIVATNPNSLILKTHTLDVTNSFSFMPSLYTHKTADEYGNTTFYLNKIIAGPGLTIHDDGDTLRLDFDYKKAQPTPCCDSNYQGADIYDPVSESSIQKITCSEFANVYLNGYDFKNKVQLDNVQCEGGFCNWSVDSYTFTITSAPLVDFDSSSSSSLSDSSSSSSSNSSSSQSEPHGIAEVVIKNLATEDNPNSPGIPNGTYTLHYTRHHFWETIDQSPRAPYISLEFVETENGWQWYANYGVGYRKSCGVGYLPNDKQLSTSPLDKENVYVYFSTPGHIISYEAQSYACGSPLFIRGMEVRYLHGGEFVWDAESSSSSSSESSSSESSSSSSFSSQTGSSNSSQSKSSGSSKSSSSSSYEEYHSPYYIRSGWYYRLKAEETTDGFFMWNLRVMKYSTYYRDCVDDEYSDYERIYDRDHDEQERKVVRQDTQLLVLTHATCGSFDLFTRENIMQPNGKFLYNEELTKDWLEATTPPIYQESDPERIEYNVDELRLDGPHNNHNINTFADVTEAWTDCGPYIVSSSSSLSDSESMGPLESTSSSSMSSESSSESKSSHSSLSNSSFSSLSSLSSDSSDSSYSSQSDSQSSQSSDSTTLLYSTSSLSHSSNSVSSDSSSSSLSSLSSTSSVMESFSNFIIFDSSSSSNSDNIDLIGKNLFIYGDYGIDTSSNLTSSCNFGAYYKTFEGMLLFNTLSERFEGNVNVKIFDYGTSTLLNEQNQAAYVARTVSGSVYTWSDNLNFRYESVGPGVVVTNSTATNLTKHEDAWHDLDPNCGGRGYASQLTFDVI